MSVDEFSRGYRKVGLLRYVLAGLCFSVAGCFNILEKKSQICSSDHRILLSYLAKSLVGVLMMVIDLRMLLGRLENIGSRRRRERIRWLVRLGRVGTRGSRILNTGLSLVYNKPNVYERMIRLCADASCGR